MVKGIPRIIGAFRRFRPMWADCCTLGILLLVAPGVPASALAGGARSSSLTYDITRNGKAVGTYRFDMGEDGDSRTVHAVMQIEVKIFGVSVYNASHERRDIWEGDRLVSLMGQSRYNNKPYEMELTRSAGTRLLTVNGVTEKLDSEAFSFVPWLPEGLASMVLLTEKGRLMKVSITDLGTETLRVGGEETPVHHYVFRGEWKRHAWYDKEGLLAVMTYDLNGAPIRLTRNQ